VRMLTDSQVWIGLAWDPGTVAMADTHGKHSRYTKALLEHLPKAGRRLQDSMLKVGKDVLRDTNQCQRTWTTDCLTEAVVLQRARNQSLRTLPMRELKRRAKQVGVRKDALDAADDSDLPTKDVIIRRIASALQVELSIQQEGLRCVSIAARCHAGGHHKLLRDITRRFEDQLAVVLAQQWRGCSASVECLLSSGPDADARPPVKLQDCLDAVARGESYLRLADGTIQPLAELGVAPQVAEGVPPSRHNRDIEPEPEVEATTPQ
jgi:chloramphenicol 3-O-phosphotransferase